jgi:hypothetical protein
VDDTGEDAVVVTVTVVMVMAMAMAHSNVISGDGGSDGDGDGDGKGDVWSSRDGGRKKTSRRLTEGARSTYFDVEAAPAASGTHRKGLLELASHDLGTTAPCSSSGGRQTVGTPASGGAVGHQPVAVPSRALPQASSRRPWHRA